MFSEPSEIDLERAHGEQPAGAGDRVTGAQTARDRVVQVRGPHRADHAQPRRFRRRSARPRRRAATATRSPRSRPPRGRPQPRRPRRRSGPAREPGSSLIRSMIGMPLGLPQHAGRVLGEAVPLRGGGVDPAAVQVGGDQHDRHRPRQPASSSSRCGRSATARPGIRPRPAGLPAAGGSVRSRCSTSSATPRRRRGTRQVQPLPGQRPLVEVHVVVPQARQHRPPVERRRSRPRPARSSRSPIAASTPSATSTSTSGPGQPRGPQQRRRAHRPPANRSASSSVSATNHTWPPRFGLAHPVPQRVLADGARVTSPSTASRSR